MKPVCNIGAKREQARQAIVQDLQFLSLQPERCGIVREMRRQSLQDKKIDGKPLAVARNVCCRLAAKRVDRQLPRIFYCRLELSRQLLTGTYGQDEAVQENGAENANRNLDRKSVV